MQNSPSKKNKCEIGSENFIQAGTGFSDPDSLGKRIEFQTNRLAKNKNRLAELEQKANELRERKAKKIHDLDELNENIRSHKEHKQLLPLIKELRAHYKKLKEQIGSGSMYQDDDVDVDEMSYEQLLELGEKIGKVSKGLTEQQFQDLDRCICMTTEQCSICQDDLVVGIECVKLKCGHMFDTECIRQWCKMEKVCPLCKEEVI